jgi:CheY-like chemotaxis protein
MSKNKKILIIEDEKDVLAYFEALFQDNGYDTVVAEDGVKGFELAKSEKPDLIALDVTMPKQSGLKTYRLYKRDSELKHIPVIIITAGDDSFKLIFDEHMEVAPPEGIFDKPFDPHKLLKAVAELLSS